MSIDGINKHFEFIPSRKFATVLKNMRRVDREDGFEKLIASTSTLSIQNVLHYLKMQWWMKEQIGIGLKKLLLYIICMSDVQHG